jgi:hypothetical protein
MIRIRALQRSFSHQHNNQATGVPAARTHSHSLSTRQRYQHTRHYYAITPYHYYDHQLSFHRYSSTVIPPTQSSPSSSTPSSSLPNDNKSLPSNDNTTVAIQVLHVWFCFVVLFCFFFDPSSFAVAILGMERAKETSFLFSINAHIVIDNKRAK